MRKKSTKKSFLEEQLESEAEQEVQTAGGETAGSEESCGAPAEGAGAFGEGVQATPPAGGEPEGLDAEALLAERDQLKDQLLRALAEFDNYRKRSAREYERIRKTAAEALVRDLLPVVDHLELALKHADEASRAVTDGVEMVARQLADVLGRHGVVPIPALGEVFDPNVHEAMMQRPDDTAAPNTVVEEFQRGYRMGDLVLRPSKVVVCAAPADEAVEGPDEVSEEE